jgi:hypothetical protein
MLANMRRRSDWRRGDAKRRPRTPASMPTRPLSRLTEQSASTSRPRRTRSKRVGARPQISRFHRNNAPRVETDGRRVRRRITEQDSATVSSSIRAQFGYVQIPMLAGASSNAG